jgi:protocatechuate 3,4-dioxygenase beta subunit
MFGNKPRIKSGIMFFVFCLAVLSITCTLNLGTQPVGPSIQPVEAIDSLSNIPMDSITRNMRIYVSPSRLLASKSDTAAVLVIVYDNNHNPVAGKAVRFLTTAGIITASDTTNVFGEAHATYKAVPINTQARVIATMASGDSIMTVAQTVTLEKLQVLVATGSANAIINTEVPVTMTVLDGTGEPVPDALITLTGTLAAQGQTSGDGSFRTSVRSSTQQTVTITASALGDADTAVVRFWTSLPDTIITQQSKNLVMRIFSSKTQLRADNSDSAVITVLLTNETNNPQQGQVIRFASTLGIISEYATVDSNGRARSVLRSAPVNGTCTVVASAAGTSLSAKTQILFSGVRLQLATSATDLKTGELATVEALVKDGSGNPINGDSVVFLVSGGVFGNDSTLFKTALDPNGKATVQVTASAAGTVKVSAQALNTSDAMEIRFTNNTLTLSASPASITIGGGQTATITAAYVDGSGAAVTNALIVFGANAGTLSKDSVYTDANGRAATTLSAGAFAATSTVQAVAANGTARTTVIFTAATAARVKLAISPDNIGVNGGVATLVATVTDSQGNMVTGASVNFRALKGPGGGEYISKPLVFTNNGVAASQLYAGSQPSQYRGCEVVATVGSVSDTSKLTISGEPYIITVSRPQDDTVTVPKGGLLDESTFQYFIGAVVQDINGNPVANGTKVHFSAFVSGMIVGALVLDHWSGIDAVGQEKKAVLAWKLKDVPFEDINNNLTMDPGIDLTLDANNAIASRGDDKNGDGTCDYNSAVHDFFWDFNGNGVCDASVGEPYLPETRFVDHVNARITDTDTAYDTVYNYKVYADLNQNGLWDRSELAIDRNGNGVCDLPASGDFRFGTWEMRDWFTFMQFDRNDFAVAIAASAETRGGVAYAQITYPRQFALRLMATVNAEANGIRDRDGERFSLPVIKEQ